MLYMYFSTLPKAFGSVSSLKQMTWDCPVEVSAVAAYVQRRDRLPALAFRYIQHGAEVNEVDGGMA